MGTVFAATDVDLGRNVAIKTVLPELHNEEGLKRFHNEMKALAAIHSSYVTHINKKLADTEGNLGFEMELFEGGTLEELIRERRHSNERVLASATSSSTCAPWPKHWTRCIRCARMGGFTGM
ncbi:hypothetical protein HMPREF3169_06215 [Corynebacterium sp. HMSC08C04]|nr:hypothetical protein HMPREF3169_06215 [Corynebacterium sp. HMSC08C04]